MGDDVEQVPTENSAMSEKTVLMIRSVEDSLAHWCPVEIGRAIDLRESSAHQ